MRSLVAIDPSINNIGLCVVHPPLSQWEVAYLQPPHDTDMGTRINRLAELVSQQVFQWSTNGPAEFELIIEQPQSWGRRKGRRKGRRRRKSGRGKPENILKLGFAYGAICGLPWRAVRTFTPGQWKGQVPKGIHTNRTEAKAPDHLVRKVRQAPEEVRDDMLDAIGLAMHATGGA